MENKKHLTKVIAVTFLMTACISCKDNAAEKIAVTGVTLDKSSLELTIGASVMSVLT
jgi:PBP1b-binding outer membrane lipoprotein LpoB